MANSGFFRDENGGALATHAGLRPAFGATGVIVATTGAAVVEADVSALPALSRTSTTGRWICRIDNSGSNAALVAFGAAGAGASFTTNDNMVIIRSGTTEYWTLNGSDASFYHLQITGATTLQLVPMG